MAIVLLALKTFYKLMLMNRFKLFIWILSALIFLAFNTEREDFQPLKNIEALKTKIKAYTSETHTIQSDFIQEKHLTMLEEVLISNGHFIFQKENNVRWEYLEPIDYAIIVYDGRFIIRDGDKIRSFDIESNRLFSEINNMIVTSVSGNFIDNPDFKTAYFENDSYYLVRLTPTNPEVKDMLSSIEIYFDKSNISVSQVKFTEPDDDYTFIKFSNKIFNQVISEDVFHIDTY